jgi:alpha-L-fucosidase
MGVTPGTYVISAIAYDLFEADTTSNFIEITVVNTLVNAAQGKETTQSSENECGEARHAVDGDTRSTAVDSSAACTKQEAQPWWQVDLGELLTIASVRVWGQIACCPEETNGYYILVSPDPITAETLAEARLQPDVTSYYVASLSESITEIAMHTGQQGRYVRIWTPDTTTLALAEVEVISEVEMRNTMQPTVFLPIIMR